MTNLRTLLAAAAGAFAILALAGSRAQDRPVPGGVVVVVIVTAAVWARRSTGIAAPVLLATMGAAGFLAVVCVRHTPDDALAVWFPWTLGMSSLTVVLTAIACLLDPGARHPGRVRSWRARRSAQRAPDPQAAGPGERPPAGSR